MKTYIAFLIFTEKGAAEIGKTTSRAEAFKKAAEKKGIQIIETYWINGPFDIIHVFKVENEEAALAHSLSLSALGNVRVQTYRAHNRDEMDRIMVDVFNPYDLLSSELK
jgi:uncharacterized protein with GYD domain